MLKEVMIKNVEGIVVSGVDYKENSKIINILTENDGIIGVMAKGSKKVNSKIAASSNVLTYGIFHLKSRNNGMFFLEEVDIIDAFKNIRKDIVKTSYSMYLIELATQVYRQDNNNETYHLLIAGLKKIEEGYDADAVNIIIELKMLDYLGIKPIVDKCINCGSKENIVTVSSYKGGYLCHNCVAQDKIYNIKTLKLIRMFYYVDVDKINKLDISNNIKKELNLFIDEYYDRYAGLYLKSKVFLQEYSKLLN